MPTEILMPALSPTMEEGTLAKWLVKEGDTVVLRRRDGRDRNRQGDDGVRSRGRRCHRQNPGRRRHRRREGQHPDRGAAGRRRKRRAISRKRRLPRPRRRPHRSCRVRLRRRRRPLQSPAPAAPRASDGGRIFASPLARRIAADKGLDLQPDQRLRPAWADREGGCRRCHCTTACRAPTAAVRPAAATPAAAMATGRRRTWLPAMYEGPRPTRRSRSTACARPSPPA